MASRDFGTPRYVGDGVLRSPVLQKEDTNVAAERPDDQMGDSRGHIPALHGVVCRRIYPREAAVEEGPTASCIPSCTLAPSLPTRLRSRTD